jgi:DNA-binding LacI/PurR family transcriptional regulator
MGRRTKVTKEKAAPQTPGLVHIVMVSRFPIDKIKETDAARGSEMDRLQPDKFFSTSARLATSFSRHIIDGIIEELQRFGLRAVIQVVNELTSRELVSEVNQEANRGLFLLGIYANDVDKFLPKCRCPVVSFMSTESHGWPDYVGIDNYAGIGMSFEHLRQLGHKKIGYMAGQLEFSVVFRERLAAYKTRLADAGLAYRPDWVVEGSCKQDAMEASIFKVLEQPDRPTAIMCCFDGAAVAVKRAADRLGLQIPQDLSVIGYDDEDIAQLFTPPLTTIRVPTVLMGRQAVQLMVMRQQTGPVKPGEACSLRVTPTLIVRQSTAAPPP